MMSRVPGGSRGQRQRQLQATQFVKKLVLPIAVYLCVISCIGDRLEAQLARGGTSAPLGAQASPIFSEAKRVAAGGRVGALAEDDDGEDGIGDNGAASEREKQELEQKVQHQPASLISRLVSRIGGSITGLGDQGSQQASAAGAKDEARIFKLGILLGR